MSELKGKVTLSSVDYNKIIDALKAKMTSLSRLSKNEAYPDTVRLGFVEEEKAYEVLLGKVRALAQ